MLACLNCQIAVLAEKTKGIFSQDQDLFIAMHICALTFENVYLLTKKS